MRIQKTDRRVSRTRHALQEAFQALVKEKGYDEVTIEEITERADLGRTTFYLHYRDKEDLLLESFGELVDDLFHQIALIPLAAWKMEETRGVESVLPVQPILAIFEHAGQHADLYRLVLRGEGVLKVTGRLREYVMTAVQAFLELKTQEENLTLNMRVPMEVFSNYFASALIGMVTWWLEQDRPYPAQKIAQMFQRLFIHGALEAVDIEELRIKT